ncbi:MAG: tellurite resistance TerB family protein [Microvirga sp.]
MIDAKRVLDAVVGASSRPGTGGTPGAALGQLAATAKDFIARNPGLAEAALMSIAGLLLRSPKGRGIARGIAGLGGLAVVGGLAYQAFRNHEAGASSPGAGADAAASPAKIAALAGAADFDPGQASEDDALLFARAMVAAAAADGRMDEAERARITAALLQAGIDAEASRWLERELADPATVDELAEPVETPEKAAQVYAAARVAIDPDTMQEREFLRQLAEALDLDPQLRAHIDEAAEGAKA